MSLRLITAPASYPVTVAEAKLHCRVDSDAEDALISGLIAAATDHIERYTGRAIIPQTWELVLDDFSDAIAFPKGPVSSVVSVKYYDSASAEQTISSVNYALDEASDPQWLVKASAYTWPEVAGGINNVKIRFQCGYAQVPAAIKQATLLLVGDWYAVREGSVVGSNVTEMPFSVTALLSNYRGFLV